MECTGAGLAGLGTKWVPGVGTKGVWTEYPGGVGTEGVWRGTKGLPSGYKEWVPRGYGVGTKVKCVPRGYEGGTDGVWRGYQEGTKWVPGVGTKGAQSGY